MPCDLDECNTPKSDVVGRPNQPSVVYMPSDVCIYLELGCISTLVHWPRNAEHVLGKCRLVLAHADQCRLGNRDGSA